MLYITVDGLTDHLGQSQILPYLRKLSKCGHQITVLSCEKPAKMESEAGNVRAMQEASGITWSPIKFYSSPPLIGAILNLLRLWWSAVRLNRAECFDMVHARSYMSALVALWLKRRAGCAFLFDMRGFWPDEKVEGGSWSLDNPAYRFIYRYLKTKERSFFEESDHIVSLTEAGKRELLGWNMSGVDEEKISVIPCCCDLARFSQDQVSVTEREQLLQSLQISNEAQVFLYLGSLGSWYGLEEMLDFFVCALSKNPKALFLFLTPEPPENIESLARAKGLPRSSFRITHVSPREVPAALSLADVGVIFIHPVYSKKGSSPTKLAELLAMEMPVIANDGVGDSGYLHDRFTIGPLVRNFTEAEYRKALVDLEEYVLIPSSEYRVVAENYFSLDRGARIYQSIYLSIEKARV